MKRREFLKSAAILPVVNPQGLFDSIEQQTTIQKLGKRLSHIGNLTKRALPYVDQTPPLNVVEWMDANFILSASSSNDAGPWRSAAYQRGPTFAMVDPIVEIYVEQKGAQVGATKRLTAVMGYMLTVLRRKVISWNPTLDDAQDFSQIHFFSMMEDVKAVRDAALVSDIYKKTLFNRLTRRMFRGAVIWFRTANTAQAFQRLTADFGAVDDFDRCPREIQSTGEEDEGTVEALAWKRVKTAPQKKLCLISTPTAEGESLIANRVQACDHIFRREIKAPCCGAYQELVFGYPTAIKTGDAIDQKEPEFGLVYSHDEGLSDDDRAKACRYKCKHCDDSFTYDQLDDADRGGRWISASGIVQHCRIANPELDPELDGKWYWHESGEAAEPRQVAYVYNSLLSRQESWQSVCNDYLSAIKDIQQGSYGAIKVFVNQTLAQTYRRPVLDKVESSALIQRLEDYAAEVPSWVQLLILSVDKQHRYFDYEVVGYGARRESAGIETGTIPGRTTEAEDESWVELTKLSKRTFKKADGTTLRLSLVMIDEGDDSGNVAAWCSQAPMLRVPCKGFGTFGHEVARKRNALPDLKTGTSPYNIGIHAASGVFYDMLAIEAPEGYDGTERLPGYCHFPKDPSKGYWEPPPAHDPTALPTSNYFDQLTAEEKTIGKRQGQQMIIYICPNGVRNEKHDNRRMNLAGLEILISNGFRLLDEYTPEKNDYAEPVDSTEDYAAPLFTVDQAYSR